MAAKPMKEADAGDGRTGHHGTMSRDCLRHETLTCVIKRTWWTRQRYFEYPRCGWWGKTHADSRHCVMLCSVMVECCAICGTSTNSYTAPNVQIYSYKGRFRSGFSHRLLDYGRHLVSAVDTHPSQTRWNENEFQNKISETKEGLSRVCFRITHNCSR